MVKASGSAISAPLIVFYPAPDVDFADSGKARAGTRIERGCAGRRTELQRNVTAAIGECREPV